MGQVELPVGVGGADDPVLAPRDDEQHGFLGAQDERGLGVHLVAVHHDVHALGRPHGEAALLAEHLLQLVGPHAGGVEHGPGPDVGLATGLGVTHPHTGDPVAVPQVADHLGGVGHDRPVVSGGARQGEGVAGVVDEGVPVPDTAHDGVLAQSRGHPARSRAAVVLLRRDALGAAHHVVEHESRGHIGAFPEPTGEREEELQRRDQVRGQARHAEFALVEGFGHQAEIELLEVAQPAVEHLRTAGGRAGGEVAGLDERHVQPPGGRVERAAGAHHTAAHDHDVEGVLRQSAPGLGAAVGAEDGSGPGRGHGRSLRGRARVPARRRRLYARGGRVHANADVVLAV